MAWTAVPLNPQYNADPMFAPGFRNHMTSGDQTSKSHTGLHSLSSALDKAKIENDHRVIDGDFPGLYAAKVSLKRNETARGEAEYGEPKLSSFFPNDMSFDEIVKAVTFAWKNARALQANVIVQVSKHTDNDAKQSAANDAGRAHASAMRKLGVTDVGTKWAGRVRLKHTNNKEFHDIWIGSPQTGESQQSAIQTAYPAINGRFL